MNTEAIANSRSADQQAQSSKAALLIGIGNDGRSDDGLGWAFLKHIEQNQIFQGRILYRFQLQIEDAETISQVSQVVFVDACRQPLPGGCQWQACCPREDVSFSSHSLSPEAVLMLCKQLYGRPPRASLLLIAGERWEIRIGLSAAARSNLQAALRLFADRNRWSPGEV